MYIIYSIFINIIYYIFIDINILFRTFQSLPHVPTLPGETQQVLLGLFCSPVSMVYETPIVDVIRVFIENNIFNGLIAAVLWLV